MGLTLSIQPLTASAFSPFGTVLEAPSRPPDIATEHNRYWDQAVPFQVSATPQVGFLEVYWRPLVVRSLERHLLHTQGFIPLGGKPLVFVVAPPGSAAAPDPDRMAAFLLDGSLGVMLHQGTWHHLVFPLVPQAHLALLLQVGTKEHDMHVVQLPEPVQILL